MDLTRHDTATEHVLTATGAVGPADTDALRTGLLGALDDGDAVDLLLDAGGVSSFDDAALPALTAARSRAKHLRRRVVVLDGDGGALATALRRSGLWYRFPVHPDAAAAHDALAAERAALEAQGFGLTAH